MFFFLPDPHLDQLVKGTDPRIPIRIRICAKMSRIPTLTETANCRPHIFDLLDPNQELLFMHPDRSSRSMLKPQNMYM
jgi:hypothetical protein